MGCKTVQSGGYVQTTGANLLPTASVLITSLCWHSWRLQTSYFSDRPFIVL